ncbi:ras-related protein Rab-15-like isoform X2 [Solea solea]|uniref:ras-related protein Rab-15-like isoform X2 n=1 Tax=Solea solea TaxID=90069 RepID=UPI00272D4B3E|nr:ras-related protein Rab-15-like isoform X2 [Solea solea]
MAKQYDILFRLLLLGDSGVGKTCMLRRFTDCEFDPSHISTIGVDFKMKTLEIDGIKVRVQIWDTAGQERYQTITKQYYRRAQGIVFVYDITSEQSFQHIAKWASDVDEYAPDKVQRMLVGNKCDDELRRQVTKEQGSKLAQSYDMEFFETSASNNSNIREVVLNGGTPCVHTCDRTGAAGSQQRRGQLVVVAGRLFRKGCSGGREGE